MKWGKVAKTGLVCMEHSNSMSTYLHCYFTIVSIDGPYVDGVSLTYGSPRQHIWTFAAGQSEFSNVNDNCPCDVTINITIPPFVGGDYFCE